MKKRQYIILGTGFLIVMVIVMMIFGGDKTKAPPKENGKREHRYVKTKKAENAKHPIIIKGHGRIGSSRNVSVIAEVKGRLMPGAVYLKCGAVFKKGQLLFRIDDTEAGLKMQARKSGFLTMLATALPDVKMDYPDDFETWENFFEQIDVAQPLPDLPEIKSVQGKTFLASKNILGEFYSIKADEERLKRYKVFAPFDGNFIDVFTEMGTVVNPGGQIARIIHTGSLEVEVPFSVSEVQFIELGNEVKVITEDNLRNYEGKILRIGKYVNPNTQSVDVFIEVDKSAEGAIYDGMYVGVEINAGSLEEVIKVPRKAMDNGNIIYTVQDSFLIGKTVSLVMKDDDFAYIKGLKNGITMVVEVPPNAADSLIVKTIPQDE
jgi:membrane fusion protein (multidrug efflux system)